MSRRTKLLLVGIAAALIIVSGLAYILTRGNDRPAPQANGANAGVMSPASPVPSVSTTQPASPIINVVDCIGNGATCEGSLNGSDGEVRVTNNTSHNWRLKLTCNHSGDQWSSLNQPSAGTVTSQASCKHGAPALYWNVISQP